MPSTAGGQAQGTEAPTTHPTEGIDVIGALILGVIAGYIGRFLMPGKDKMGFIATVALGLAGSLLGFLLFTKVLGIGDDKAFDLGGLVGAIIGVVLLLAVFRMAQHDKRDKRTERKRRPAF
jgi:uncharacterized membrane protein YeaQ/YmgE (transglycosylase-associated protein family)